MSADNAQVEIEWSLVGLWAMALYSRVKANQNGTPPEKVSIAQVLRAFRRMLRDYRHPSQRGKYLSDHLRNAVIDSYQRQNKASRDFPRKKQESPPGMPQFIDASKNQVKHAKRLAPCNK